VLYPVVLLDAHQEAVGHQHHGILLLLVLQQQIVVVLKDVVDLFRNHWMTGFCATLGA
jgi:hypothetical protein